MNKLAILIIAISICSIDSGYADDVDDDNLAKIDAYTLQGKKNFLTDFDPVNPDGTINVVVEIPTGTTAKWEVDKSTGDIKWELKDGKPRIVNYLGYPGNYGMMPRTLLPKEMGGDGDPLDVIVLGPAVLRGSVVRARVVGVLKLLDGGEQDDKILAVLDGDPLAAAGSIQELDEEFPGVTTIVKTWFVNYKGPRELESTGFKGPNDAMKIIETAGAAFTE